jgi:hypothetical protein
LVLDIPSFIHHSSLIVVVVIEIILLSVHIISHIINHEGTTHLIIPSFLGLVSGASPLENCKHTIMNSSSDIVVALAAPNEGLKGCQMEVSSGMKEERTLEVI